MNTERKSVMSKLSNGGVAFYPACELCGHPEHPARPHPPVGTRMYNHGDMANPPHFGTVVGYRSRHMEIRPDASELYDGKETYCFPAAMVSHEFNGHSGTRIVTEAAYRAYRKARIDEMSK